MPFRDLVSSSTSRPLQCDSNFSSKPLLPLSSTNVVALTFSLREYWAEWPVPTVSKDSADYCPTNYWSGRAWPPRNFRSSDGHGQLRMGRLPLCVRPYCSQPVEEGRATGALVSYDFIHDQ